MASPSSENFNKIKTFNNYFRTIAAHLQKLTMPQCSLSPSASSCVVGFQNLTTLFLALKMVKFNEIKETSRSSLKSV